MAVLGIDVGASGALAVIADDGSLTAIHDMPVLRDGPKGRRTINAPLLANILAQAHVECAYVEAINARPTDGHVGAFAFGRAKGLVEGVCATLDIPVQFLTPPQWKRLVGIKPGKEGAKDAARSLATKRWPSRAELFARVKDDGRAEAALIAVAGRLSDKRPADAPQSELALAN